MFVSVFKGIETLTKMAQEQKKTDNSNSNNSN